tara:strand:+ start:11195 stop:12355 length:1161 start_codon:yes stop_codon:yes gene_type:complete
MEISKKIFKKKDSFLHFKNTGKKSWKVESEKILNFLNKSNYLNTLNDQEKDIILRIKKDLKLLDDSKDNLFLLKNNSIVEFNTYDNESDKIQYLIHRYRYDIFPSTKELYDYPPLVQIEPSSICNFRCVFCFETDKTFTNKKNGHMGTMQLEVFKKIIDQIHNKVQFITLASRGEPLVSKDFNNMLKYTAGKFLNVKINTNASLLNEEKSHAILSSGVKTVVFSADAADEKLYSKLRVNGNLTKTLNNIKKFNEVKNKHYSKAKIITRVSGVKFSSDQNFEDMENFWGSLVDQVAFVDYNPWENNYEKEPNNITTACSDLWRRMFIWWDGKVNPCDVDYKSNLSVGNILNKNVKDLWLSKEYENLRNKHTQKKRSELTPCKSCSVV